MKTLPPIAQLVHTLSYGDAISTEVLALDRFFADSGRESYIYALNEHPNLRGKTRSFPSLPELQKADLILHYSLGSPLNSAYASWTKGSRTLIYHNITPPFWYSRINSKVAFDIEQGLKELPELCALSDKLLSDSSFNSQELSRLGFSSDVLGLPVDPSRWDRPRNQGIYDLVKNEGGLHLLHVGRLAPNKCIEDIIKIFHFTHHYGEKQSKLWLVGIDTDTELYSFSLKRLAAELGVEHAVSFVGCLADEEVRALYEACSVYLCMSEHEGFCLPLIEAMHFGLPIIAYDSSAVPETLHDGGILVKEKRHAEIAEIVCEIYSNREIRSELVSKARDHVDKFSFQAFCKRAAEIFDPSQGVPQAHGA